MTTVRPRRLRSLTDWDRRYEGTRHRHELVKGVPLMATSQIGRHQNSVAELLSALKGHFGTRRRVWPGAEITIEATSPPTIRIPDVVVLPRDVDMSRHRYDATDVELAVEVGSPGSKRLDRVTKYDEYQKAGIERYWIVDPNDPITLTAYRLVGGKYEIEAEGTGVVTVEFNGRALVLDVADLEY